MPSDRRFPAPIRLAIPAAGLEAREHQRLTTEAIRELAAAYNSLADDLTKSVTELIVIGNEVRHHNTTIAEMMRHVMPVRPVADSIADPIEEAARELSRRAHDKRDPMTSDRARAIAQEVQASIATGVELRTWRGIKGGTVEVMRTAAKEAAKVAVTLGIAYLVAHLAKWITW